MYVNAKMRSVETVPGMGGGEGWKSSGEGEFKYIWYIVRTFTNATMYPHQAQQ
jgi:hypothetical protein